MLNIKDALAAHAECDRKVILTENKNHPYDLAEKKTDHLLVMILYKVRGSKEMNQNTLRGR